MNVLKGDIIFWSLMAISLVIVILANIFIEVDAVTRTDINNLENSINSKQKSIDVFTDRIISQNKIIKEFDISIDHAKSILRDVKQTSGKSYTASQDITAAEKELQDAYDDHALARQGLGNLLTMRSDLIKEVKQLKKQLVIDEDQFRKDTRIELSDYHKLIGIELSNSCLVMIKAGINSTCPDYLTLSSVDTSIKDVSGDFITTDGFFHRDKSNMVNSWKFYENDPTIRIIVDPTQGMSERIRMITVVPNFDTYLIKSNRTQDIEYEFIEKEYFNIFTNQTEIRTEKIKIQENSRILYHDRYVEDCSNAKINAEKWRELIPDTIHYLRTDCEITQFNEIEIIPTNYTEIDITQSAQWKYEQWLKHVTENCIFQYSVC